MKRVSHEKTDIKNNDYSWMVLDDSYPEDQLLLRMGIQCETCGLKGLFNFGDMSNVMNLDYEVNGINL